MRRGLARLLIASLPVAGPLALSSLTGCARPLAQLPGDGRARGTVRVFAGTHVPGHYVSPVAYEHYMRAQLASLAGRSGEAVDELQRALGSDGASAYLRTRLAEELLALGRVDEAREELDAALRLDPAFAEAWVDRGRVELSLGDGASAERSFRRAFEIDRACEDAYLALAQLYRDRGDGRRADEVYKTLGERLPRSAAAHFHLAHAAGRRGDLARMEAELRQALDSDPSYVDAARALGELLIADGRAAAAEEVLARAVEASSDVGLAGLLYDAQLAAGHGELAGALVDKLVDDGGDAEHRLALGWLLVDRRLGARALALAESLLAAVADDEPAVAAVRALRGASLAAMRQTQLALAELRRVPDGSPDYLRAQITIARLLCDSDHPDEAAQTLLRAARAIGQTIPAVERGRHEAHRRDDEAVVDSTRSAEGDALVEAYARAREKAGDRSAALRVLEAARKARPTSDTLRYAEARMRIRAGEWQGAVELVRPLLDRRADDADALRFVGDTIADHTDDRGQLDEARKLLEAALGERPTSPEVADSLGWAYLKLGRDADAERLLVRAARRKTDDPQVLAHLGALYLRHNDRARALDAYRRALASKPEERLRHAVEEQLLLLESGRVGSR